MQEVSLDVEPSYNPDRRLISISGRNPESFESLVDVLKDYPMLLVAILFSSGVAIPIASAQIWGSRICIE
jgi:hypothetical protein